MPKWYEVRCQTNDLPGIIDVQHTVINRINFQLDLRGRNLKVQAKVIDVGCSRTVVSAVTDHDVAQIVDIRRY